MICRTCYFTKVTKTVAYFLCQKSKGVAILSEEMEARLRKLALELAHILSDDAITSRQTALIETARESIEEVYRKK